MRKLELKKAVVCIIGLGYIGLPIAEAFSRSMKVIGFDIDSDKIGELTKSIKNSNLLFTDNDNEITKADFIIVCVPTPVTRAKEVDLSFVENAARIAGRNMKKGSTVILESTVYPGVTEDVVRPILERKSSLKCGVDFKIGYSPERINPGDTLHTVDKTTKVVAGMDKATTEVMAELYSRVAPSVFKARDIQTAEASKLVENIQRDLNIALVNEFAVIFERLGLSTRDVLDAAGTKWNFHRYSPGLVGGYCIPVNPYYLMHKAREMGYNPQVIQAGRDMNNSVPKRVADMMSNALKEAGKKIKGSTVLIMGLTYKADVPDIRESATKHLVKELKDSGVRVVGYDPNVDKEKFKRNWEDEFRLKMLWNIDDIKKAEVDGIIITVAHSPFRKLRLTDLQDMQSQPPILIDIPGSYDAGKAKKAGFYYKTL